MNMPTPHHYDRAQVRARAAYRRLLALAGYDLRKELEWEWEHMR